MLRFFQKLVPTVPQQAGIKLLFAMLTFSIGLLVLRWVNVWQDGGLQSRLAYTQALQRSVQGYGRSVTVICEEKPKPLLRLIHARWNSDTAALTAMAFQRKEQERLHKLGFKQLQLTNGTETWTYPIP